MLDRAVVPPDKVKLVPPLITPLIAFPLLDDVIAMLPILALPLKVAFPEPALIVKALVIE